MGFLCDFGGQDHQARSSLTPKFRTGSLLPSTSLGQRRTIVICTQVAWLTVPTDGRDERSVDRQLGTTEEWQAVCNDLEPSVRRGRPLGGPNRGRKHWWTRERRPHGKLVQQRFPRRNRDSQAHPPLKKLLSHGHGSRGDGHTGRCEKRVEVEARDGEGEAQKERRETRRMRGRRDDRERKSRHGPRLGTKQRLLRGSAPRPHNFRPETLFHNLRGKELPSV